MFLASIVGPQPLSSFAERGRQKKRRTRRRDMALVLSERGASKIVKAVYTGRAKNEGKKRGTVRTARAD